MKRILEKNFFNFSKKNFSVLPKVTKMEVNMRTPYKTFFNKFNGFSRIYVNTLKGLIAIGNRTYPTIYLLPAGEIKYMNLVKSEGNECSANASGEFIHTGGYCVVHE